MTAILQQPARPAPAPTTGGAAVVLGTRSEIFQLAPVLCALGDQARVVRVGGDLPTPTAQSPLAAADPRTGRLADPLDQRVRV
ncbi:MAG: hypothetical protein HOY78_38475 [Saccharothrix sp.]|nr:hypothetical protein [Saccharothrix sp.]